MSWMQAEEAFAKNRPGFEPRLPQRAMAQKIEVVLADSDHALVQAPCGVGKSYAGLVPHIDWALETGGTVVVATAMKSLQDQYINTDLPELAAKYRPFRYAIIKGRANYLCRAKLDKLAQSELRELPLDELQKLIKSGKTDGDMDRLGLPMDDRGFDRSKVTTSSDECPGKNDCPFGSVCFAEVAKQKAKEAHIVVANHSLVVTDALIGRGNALLPPYEKLLIDEGHELESYTINALSSDITSRALLNLAGDVSSFVNKTAIAHKAEPLVANLFGALADRIDPKSKERTTPLDAELIADMGDEILACIEMIWHWEVDISGVQIHGDDFKSQQKARLKKRVTNMGMRLEGIVMADFADLVRWVEKDDKRGIVLKYSPINVSQFLRTNLWNEVPSVLMSATLAVGTDFSFLAERLGFDLNKIQTFDCETMFDFRRQARTYVPRGMADPSQNGAGWRVESNHNMGELIKASDGRALMLFTSLSEMRHSYDTLAPMIEGMGHRALYQGQMPPAQLKQIFIEDEHSVLFAVKSFFTGIDVQGDSLRLVCINKLPFPVPSDVLVKAITGLIDAKNGGSPWGKKGSFEKWTIPTMTLDLLQAYGRLIRSVHDRGVVAITDPRLFTKRYGSTILNAFPPAPVVDTLDEATAFLRSLDAVSA